MYAVYVHSSFSCDPLWACEKNFKISDKTTCADLLCLERRFLTGVFNLDKNRRKDVLTNEKEQKSSVDAGRNEFRQ